MALVPVWANAGRGHIIAHEQRLPCSEVLQHTIDHQKMGSKEVALGAKLLSGGRRDICGALGSTREVAGG